MKHIILSLCCVCTSASASVFGQISPGILIPDPNDDGSSRPVDENLTPDASVSTLGIAFDQISPGVLIPDPNDNGSRQRPDQNSTPRDRITTPGSDTVDPRINWADELPFRKLEFDEASLNTALAIAARDQGRSGNPFTLIVQLQSVPTPEEAQKMQDFGQSLQEVRSTSLEAAFSSREGRRALYNPNYPLLGEVLSIPVDPEDLEKWIVRIPREIPQAKKVRAEQNSYALQPSQLDNAGSGIHSSRIETVRRSDAMGEGLKGQPLCRTSGNRLQILVQGGDSRLDTSVSSSPESELSSSERKSRRNPLIPKSVGSTNDADLSEWFIVLRGANTKDEIETKIQQFGGIVSSASSRQVAFRGNSDLVEKLRKAGLRAIKKP